MHLELTLKNLLYKLCLYINGVNSINIMQTNLQKWGNSLAVRIPSFITNQLSLHPGDSVDLIANNQQISIRPRKKSLAVMLAQITEKNIHDQEWESVDIKGKETW
jgi:antitoxin MazE